MIKKLFLFTVIIALGLISFTCTKDNDILTKPVQSRSNEIIVHTARANTVLVTEQMALNQTDTMYILQNDIIADSTAFTVGASNISFDLNGYSITYANAGGLGRGFIMSTWNKVDFEIFNGSIIQSINVDPEDITLVGQSPIYFQNPTLFSNGHIHDLYLEYRSAQTDGIYMAYGNDHIVHDNVIVDQGTVITNRHQYRLAIAVANGNNAQIYNNTITCRQGGIGPGNGANVYNNNITMVSVATNSMGIVAYSRHNINIYDNIIRGTGMACIGIGVISESTNINVYGNYVEVQNTEYNPEYASTHSAAFRMHWGLIENIEVWDNDFISYGEADILPGPEPDSETWCLWIGLPVAGGSAHFYNNRIKADNKGTGAEAAALCIIGGNVPGTDLVIENNIIESNWACIYLGNNYAGSDGFPLIKNNTFRQLPGAMEFYTMREYRWDDPPSTGRFVNNTFDSPTNFFDMGFAWNGAGGNAGAPPWCGRPAGVLPKVDIRKAYEYKLVVLNSTQSPMNGVIVEIRTNTGELVFNEKTGTDGAISTTLDSYALTNCDEYPPEYIILDFLESGAHKAVFSPYKVTITNGTKTYRTFDLNVVANKYHGIVIRKNNLVLDPPYDLEQK